MFILIKDNIERVVDNSTACDFFIRQGYRLLENKKEEVIVEKPKNTRTTKKKKVAE